MARSTRVPYWCDNKTPGATKYWKRQASKRARRARSLPDGGSYQKVFCSRNIHDWKYYDSDKNSKAKRK